jgi:hypothetical protein
MEGEVSQPNQSKGLGIAGFVLSLIGLVSLLFYPLALILAILGLIFSIIQLRKNKTGLAVAGLVISLITIALGLIALAATFLWVKVVTDIKSDLGSSGNCMEAQASLIIQANKTCINRDTGDLSLGLRNGMSRVNLKSILVEINSSSGNFSEVIPGTSLMNNQEKTFSFTNSNYKGATNLIISAVISSNGADKSCGVSQSINLIDC